MCLHDPISHAQQLERQREHILRRTLGGFSIAELRAIAGEQKQVPEVPYSSRAQVRDKVMELVRSADRRDQRLARA